MLVRLRTFFTSFKARLSRRIVFWVFGSIVAIESIILVPSYLRRERELLAQIERVSETTVDSVVRVAERGMYDERIFLDRLDVLLDDPYIIGFAIYGRDGALLEEVGEPPALDPSPFFDSGDRQGEVMLGSQRQGDRYDIAYPIGSLGTPYTLVVRHDASSVSRELWEFTGRIAGLVLIISAFVTLTTVVAVQFVVIAPLLKLRRDLAIAGKTLRRNDLQPDFASLECARADELGDTIRAFGQMFERVCAEIDRREAAEACLREQAAELEAALDNLQRAQLKLVQTEKMSSLGQLVAGVAHEINNPISFVRSNLEPVGEYAKDLMALLRAYEERYPEADSEIDRLREDLDLDFVLEDLPHLLDSMKAGSDRIRNIVLSLRNFARFQESERKTADLHEGLDSTLELLHNRLETAKVRVLKHYGSLPPLDCYPGALNQAFFSTIANAMDALEMTDEGDRRLTLTTEAIGGTDENAPDRVAVRIADTGPGIPPEQQQKLFDPFFTTKPVGKGTGLGLAIVYQIVVEQHGGEVRCQSQVGKGTEFIFELPATAREEKGTVE